MATKKQAQEEQEPYRVLARLYWEPGQEAFPGEVRSDIRPGSIPWLEEQGYIEPVTEGKEEADGHLD